MASSAEVALLPLTKTARRYGYITWREKHDDEMHSILGSSNAVNLIIGDTLKREKAIDWKRRRIGITYTFTRSLPSDIKNIRLRKEARHSVTVTFE
jgi:hypothetical protein